MTRGVFNWTFINVVKFLKKHGFVHANTKGSHYYYVGKHGGKVREVSVPFHGNKTFKPRTLKGMVKQSGIHLNIWLEG